MRTLYCDESIWIPVADGLRRRGWTVRTARGEGQLGESDQKQLHYSRKKDWIVVTFDDDFLSLMEREGLEHAGIIFVQQAGRNIGDVVKTIDSQLERELPDKQSIVYC